MPTDAFPQRRPSRSANRRSKILPSLPSKARPGLAVDTSVSRHRAPAPQQVFPAQTKTQELSFISLADIKALKKQRSIKRAHQRQLENVQPPSVQRSYSERAAEWVDQADVPPPYTRSNTTDNSQAMHKRIKGLRPSPLNLSTDISPSDRAITIGLSVDPQTVSTHSRTPSSPAAAVSYPDAKPQRWPSEKYNGQEVVTPTIVITPAKEDFNFELAAKTSPEDRRNKGHRPTSSVYSRYTNCMPANGYTPPVPPLPLFAVGKNGGIRETDKVALQEADNLRVPKRGREKNLSVCTVFEEDQPATARSAKRLISQSHLPTPRRSRGWWNLITSPFSASSRSNAFFWRSPPPNEDGDRSRMLDNVSDEHAGIIFTNRTPDDLDLRSAPPVDAQRNSLNARRPHRPKRSATAPGALDPSGEDGVNIYKVPYVGAAADYYNPHKNFPSIYMSPAEDGIDRGLDGWSPSQSVYHEPRGSVRGVVVDADDDDDGDTVIDENPFDDEKGAARALDDEKSPFSDAHASTAFQDFSGTHPAATAEKKFFSTPETAELRGASPDQPVRPGLSRNDTVESHFSPLTATPVIEDARMGTLMGPSVVDVRATPAPRAVESPHASGLGAATMASRGIDDNRAVSEKAPFRQHTGNDSYGLGIDTDTESMSEKSLFPPPKPLAQQPRLGTDRFGQLRIEKEGARDVDWVPWYRRFLWPLLGLAAGCLVLFVVLLVLFVSQSHDDMPVQAEWLNLTGFPAMPTGVSTVVQPKKDMDVGGCVKPDGLWSCNVPAAMNGGGSGEESAPNFRFEIRFRNKTRSDMNATDLTPLGYKRSISGPSYATTLVKRSEWSESLYASVPAPPKMDEMVFLGNTTDNITEPYEGEETPFYLTLLNATALEEPAVTRMRLVKREKGAGVYPYPNDSSDSATSARSSRNTTSSSDDTSHNSASSNADPDAPTTIPRPLLLPDGSPAPAQLYPLASAQPLRLFNRGQDSEHYGFSTFFDRSLYIHTSNTSAPGLGSGAIITANTPLQASNALCTFTQTRLHMQIWTRKGGVAGLEPNADRTAAAKDSSANDMAAPGSFPYHVTVTLDRHGGAAGEKGVFCYGIDGEGRVVDDASTWVEEDRGFGGGVVNAAAAAGKGKRDDGDYEGGGKGIDGGDGGCGCSWRS